MMKLAQVLVVALFLALTLSACAEDEPGSSPDTAVLFGTTPTNIGVGGTRSYYGYLYATSTSHTVDVTNVTQDFAVIRHGIDASYNSPDAGCNNPGVVPESCVIGTTINYYYYFVIKNQSAGHGTATVTIN
jgi:hypothetical protein